MRISPIFVLLVLTAGCDNPQPERNSEQNQLGLDTSADTYSVTAEDTGMNAAIARARQTLMKFDQAFESEKPNCSAFAVKKRFATADGGGEHMWVTIISIADDVYKGYVNNDAEKTQEVKYGDTVLVRKNEITDWMYLENNVLRGGYTIREIRNQMTGDERKQWDKDLGFKIED